MIKRYCLTFSWIGLFSFLLFTLSGCSIKNVSNWFSSWTGSKTEKKVKSNNGSKVIEVTNLKVLDEAIDSGKRIIIKFFATWCPPCKASAPVFARLSNELTDIMFMSVNIDSLPSIATRYGIRGVPSFVLIKDGKEVARFTGFDASKLSKKYISDKLS